MEKNSKIIIGVLAIIAIAAIGFALMQPMSFESELEQMSKVWQEKGVEEYYLHESPELFSMSESEINSIKSGLVSFKARASLEETKALSDVYVSFLENAELYSNTTALQESVRDSGKSPCDELEVFDDLQANLQEMKGKRTEFSNLQNEFIEEYPEKAKLISLKASEVPENDDDLQLLIQINNIFKEEC